MTFNIFLLNPEKNIKLMFVFDDAKIVLKCTEDTHPTTAVEERWQSQKRFLSKKELKQKELSGWTKLVVEN